MVWSQSHTNLPSLEWNGTWFVNSENVSYHIAGILQGIKSGGLAVVVEMHTYHIDI